jgi:hypothetical protein
MSEQLNILIEPELKHQLKIFCATENITTRQLITDAIRKIVGAAPAAPTTKVIDGRSTRTQSSWDIRQNGLRWEDSF